MTTRSNISAWILPALIGSVALAASTALATITPNGDVSPADPNTWTTSTSACIGNTLTGSVMADNGSALVSAFGYLGYVAGSSGTVTVDGATSTWTSAFLYVGNSGNGTLNIQNGGQVTATTQTNIGYGSGSIGTINFGPGGGTLTTRSLYGAPSQFTGTGTLNARGLIADLDVVFDATHPLSQTMLWNSAGQNVAVNFDMSGASGAAGDLGAGYSGTGTLTIRDARVVTSLNAALGYKAGSTGTATVDGAGSAWNTYYSLYVGYYGAGTLNISNGGAVSALSVLVGPYSGSAGVIHFNSGGGTLTTGTLQALPSQITGTGTINARGLFSDGDLVFDATHGLSQTLTWNNPGQNVTVSLDLTGASGAVGALCAGYQGNGTLTIRDGMQVTNASGALGDLGGSTGIATVTGPGSMWTASNQLSVGIYGAGTLNVSHGGTVKSGGPMSVGLYSTGKVSITSGGAVSVNGTFPQCLLGYNSGSTGTVAVDGAGSTWAIGSLQGSPMLGVGYFGSGRLTITNGGTVSVGVAGGPPSMSYIGNSLGSTGTVNVDGAGSTWTNTGYISLGAGGSSGLLNITNGGKVTANGVTIFGPSPVLSINVGDGSTLNAGLAGLNNMGGTVRLKAVPGLAAGSYNSPITGWTGSGTVQALGGSWNSSTLKFTVATAITGNAGSAVPFDPSGNQRVFITDATGGAVEAAFQAATSSSSMSFTATDLTGGQSALLASDLGPGGSILSAWTFSATGYTPGNPVGLSLGIGPGYSIGQLTVWHYNGSEWAQYAATDLSYDGTYADFTVMGFSGYAVTVPEPGSLCLLALGGGVLLARRRKTA